MMRPVILLLVRLCAVFALVLASVALIGYLTGNVLLHNWPGSAGMAVPTACGIASLGIGLLLLTELIDKSHDEEPD
jgi:hypothetical protein